MCYFSTHQSIYLSCLPACLPTCLPACLPICLPAYLPTYLPTYLFDLSIRSAYSTCLFDLFIRPAYSIRLFNLPPTINTRAGVIFQHINHLSTLPSYPICLSNIPINLSINLPTQSAYSICLSNLPVQSAYPVYLSNLPFIINTRGCVTVQHC